MSRFKLLIVLVPFFIALASSAVPDYKPSDIQRDPTKGNTGVLYLAGPLPSRRLQKWFGRDFDISTRLRGHASPGPVPKACLKYRRRRARACLLHERLRFKKEKIERVLKALKKLAARKKGAIRHMERQIGKHEDRIRQLKTGIIELWRKLNKRPLPPRNERGELVRELRNKVIEIRRKGKEKKNLEQDLLDLHDKLKVCKEKIEELERKLRKLNKVVGRVKKRA